MKLPDMTPQEVVELYRRIVESNADCLALLVPDDAIVHLASAFLIAMGQVQRAEAVINSQHSTMAELVASNAELQDLVTQALQTRARHLAPHQYASAGGPDCMHCGRRYDDPLHARPEDWRQASDPEFPEPGKTVSWRGPAEAFWANSGEISKAIAEQFLGQETKAETPPELPEPLD